MLAILYIVDRWRSSNSDENSISSVVSNPPAATPPPGGGVQVQSSGGSGGGGASDWPVGPLIKPVELAVCKVSRTRDELVSATSNEPLVEARFLGEISNTRIVREIVTVANIRLVRLC